MTENDSSERAAEVEVDPTRKHLAPPCQWPSDGEFLLASEAMTPLMHLWVELTGADNLPTRSQIEAVIERIKRRDNIGGQPLTQETREFYLRLLGYMDNGAGGLYLILMSAFQLGYEWKEREEINGD